VDHNPLSIKNSTKLKNYAFEKFRALVITGAQLLYGGDTVKIVDGHSKRNG
jgi:hypothetical protein